MKLTKKEMVKLLTDSMKRSANLKSKLYKCKILKKCKKIFCVGKNRRKCNGADKKASRKKPRKKPKKEKKKRKKKKVKSSMLRRQSSVLDFLKSF